MIIPSILPGEHAYSFLIRIKKINGIRGGRGGFIRRIKKTFSHMDDPSDLPLVIYLARSLNITSEKFCQFHTVLPIKRSVVSKFIDISHGNTSYPDLMKFTSGSVISKLCAQCAEEDIDFHGFSYWRTEHQFPGIHYCTKHSKVLTKIEGLILEFPDLVIKSNKASLSISKLFETNRSIKNYQIIIDAWSHSLKPINNLMLVQIMQNQAKKLGCGWIDTSKLKVSDLVYESFPLEWLQQIIPGIESKKNGQYYGTIDRLLSPQPIASRGCLYAVILSVLFENPEDALNSIYNYSTPPPKIVIRKSFNKENPNRSTLQNLYIAHNGIFKEISRQKGVASETIKNTYQQLGLVSLHSLPPKLQHALVDFESGLSILESSNKNNVNPIELERQLRRFVINQVNVIKIVNNKKNKLISNFA